MSFTYLFIVTSKMNEIENGHKVLQAEKVMKPHLTLFQQSQSISSCLDRWIYHGLNFVLRYGTYRFLAKKVNAMTKTIQRVWLCAIFDYTDKRVKCFVAALRTKEKSGKCTNRIVRRWRKTSTTHQSTKGVQLETCHEK